LGAEEKFSLVTDESAAQLRQTHLDLMTIMMAGGLPTLSQAKRSKKAKRHKDDGLVFSPLSPIPHSRPILPTEHVWLISRETILNTINSSVTLSTFSGMKFMMSQVNDASALSAVFDLYRFTKIELWLEPVGQTTAASQTYGAGSFVSVIDLDDASTPSSYADVIDFASAVVTTGTQGHYRSFQPHAAVALYSGAFTSYGSVASPWIDFASPGVEHYGVKTAWSATDTGLAYRPTVRFTIEVKATR